MNAENIVIGNNYKIITDVGPNYLIENYNFKYEHLSQYVGRIGKAVHIIKDKYDVVVQIFFDNNNKAIGFYPNMLEPEFIKNEEEIILTKPIERLVHYKRL